MQMFVLHWVRVRLTVAASPIVGHGVLQSTILRWCWCKIYHVNCWMHTKSLGLPGISRNLGTEITFNSNAMRIVGDFLGSF